MKVRFWGVRGSIPVPGPATVRYGGNTSCVEVIPDDGNILIIDAGTGIRKLGKRLMQGPCGRGEGRIHLLISHTHWDHIQGLPFFAPLYREGNQLTVYARERNDAHLAMVLRTATEDPYFPVPFEAAQAGVTFRELTEGEAFKVGALDIRCARLNHPWIALAYRVQEKDAIFAYVSDTAPFSDMVLENEYVATPPSPEDRPSAGDAAKLAEMKQALIDLCQGAQVVVFDTMFTMDEYNQRPHWGHSAPEHALEICRKASVKRLVLFHHAPSRDDDQVDAIVEETRKIAPDLEVQAAAEMTEMDV